MHRLFGKKKDEPPPPSLDEATSGIGARIKALDVKIAGLNKELIRYRDQMKKASGPAKAGIQRRAMETMKRKKAYEQQRDQMAGQQFNIDSTAFAIDSVKDAQTTVAAMKGAAKTLKVS